MIERAERRRWRWLWSLGTSGCLGPAGAPPPPPAVEADASAADPATADPATADPATADPATADDPLEASGWERLPPMPMPVANNAVVGLPGPDAGRVLSLLGLGPGKTHADVLSRVFVLDEATSRWAERGPVPGSPGRLAATAQRVGGRVLVFGGYTVAPDGHEVSLERVDIYDPDADRWSRAAPMPIPVDDAVSGVWRDRFVVLVSGWSQRDNVPDVQVYDSARDSWRAASPPFPGRPVFGHAGGLVGDTLVVCDGVAVHASPPRFRVSPGCVAGRLRDEADAVTIDWRPLPDHPGRARYRSAAGSVPARGWVVFAGGTARPYNYDGIGYDGVPADPEAAVFAWDVDEARWLDLPPLPQARMDHRALAVLDDRVLLVGGMNAQREVVASGWQLRLPTPI